MSKIKILLAEDDINLGTVLSEYLKIKNFEVTLVKDGEEADKAFNDDKFSLCIFDVMMPKKDGFALTSDIRKKDNNIPIVFLTAKVLQEDKIEGFKIGCDDYITKPFNVEELVYRIQSILRRTGNIDFSPNSQSEKIFKIGDYLFDYQAQKLIFKRNVIKVTNKEAELLKLLCLNLNGIVERKTALTTVWGDDNYYTARSMDVYITKLRSLLKKDKSIEIVNIHGAGYKLIIS